MNGDVSIPPLRDLPPARLAQRREHLLSEIAQPPSRSPLPRRGLLAVPTVVADRDDVLDRAGARSGTPTRPPSRWRVVAIAVAIVAGAALLVTPALGIGDRLLSLIQGKPSRLDVQAPAWSPDGRTIVFVSWRDGNGEVYAMDADSSSPRNLTQHPAKDVASCLVARRTEDRLRKPARRQLRGLRHERRREREAEPHARSGERRLSNLVTRRAEDRVPARPPRTAATLPPDRFYSYDLYVVNADGSGLRRLHSDTGRVGFVTHPLVWSPDGRTIYFGRYRRQDRRERSAEAPVHTVDRRLVARRAADRRSRASRMVPDGASSVLHASHTDIYVMNADGSGTRKLTHNARQNAEPVWSPDGRKIAFRSTRNGNREIYVMNADGSGKRNLTRNPARD